MYTVWLGNRAHVVDDEAAEVISSALRGGLPVVEIDMALGSDPSSVHRVTLVTAHILALVRHNDVDAPATSVDANVVPLRVRAHS